MRKRLHTVATGWLLAGALLAAGSAWGQCDSEPTICTPATCCFDRWNTVIDATTACVPASNNYTIYLSGNSDNYTLSGISLEGVTICIGNNDIDIDASVIVDDQTRFLSQGQFGVSISFNGFTIYEFTNNGQGGPNTNESLKLLNDYLAANCVGGCTMLQAAFSALPVTLLDWTVGSERSGIVLEWATANEKNNDYFLVERSTDGRTFREIGRVAGQGTAESLTTYRLVDETPGSGRNYYRLSQFDFDGKSEVFGVRSADWDRGTVKLQPNPVRAGTELWVELPAGPVGPITLYSPDGRQWARYVLAEDGQQPLRLPADLPAGVYLLRIDRESYRIAVF